jgi:hypothetical protein
VLQASGIKKVAGGSRCYHRSIEGSRLQCSSRPPCSLTMSTLFAAHASTSSAASADPPANSLAQIFASSAASGEEPALLAFHHLLVCAIPHTQASRCSSSPPSAQRVLVAVHTPSTKLDCWFQSKAPSAAQFHKAWTRTGGGLHGAYWLRLPQALRQVAIMGNLQNIRGAIDRSRGATLSLY